jgi:hypothetical protein
MGKHNPGYINNLNAYDAWLYCNKNVAEAAKYIGVPQSQINAAIAWVKQIPVTSQNEFDPETGRVILKNPAHREEYNRLVRYRSEAVAYNYARCVTLNLGRGASHHSDRKR